MIYLQLPLWIWILTPNERLRFIFPCRSMRSGPTLLPTFHWGRARYLSWPYRAGQPRLAQYFPWPYLFSPSLWLTSLRFLLSSEQQRKFENIRKVQRKKILVPNNGKLIYYGENWCGSFCFGITYRKRKRIIATQVVLPVRLRIRLGKWTWA